MTDYILGIALATIAGYATVAVATLFGAVTLTESALLIGAVTLWHMLASIVNLVVLLWRDA